MFLELKPMEFFRACLTWTHLDPNLHPCWVSGGPTIILGQFRMLTCGTSAIYLPVSLPWTDQEVKSSKVKGHTKEATPFCTLEKV